MFTHCWPALLKRTHRANWSLSGFDLDKKNELYPCSSLKYSTSFLSNRGYIGGPMRRKTIEMGGRWAVGVGANGMGYQWNGWCVGAKLGTNEMGDQWDGDKTWNLSCKVIPLTHWGRNKMTAISKTTFPKAFSWMKFDDFRLIFHWSLFLRLELTIFLHWFI